MCVFFRFKVLGDLLGWFRAQLRMKLGAVMAAALAQTYGDFPKIRGTVFWCPYSKDPTI